MKLNIETINKSKEGKRFLWIKVLSLIYITIEVYSILGRELRPFELFRGLLFILVFNYVLKSAQVKRYVKYLFISYIIYWIAEQITLRFFYRLYLVIIFELIELFLKFILGLTLIKSPFKNYGISIMISITLLVVSPFVYAGLVNSGITEFNPITKRFIFIIQGALLLVPYCTLMFIPRVKKSDEKYILDDQLNLED